MKLTQKEWNEKGTKLFGENYKDWKFKCPSCERVTATHEFEQFKDKGATPNSAYQECIGRYTGGRSGPHKCDWCAYGFLRGPHVVVAEDDGTEIPVFPFAEEDIEKKEN